ncbi:hypothetical protein QQP08_010403 [Theobroma cacao]|nr:hypothetical protein QQP08_010403 [Theobroma cacao]
MLSGWNVVSMHGGKAQHERTNALSLFKDGSSPLMILATYDSVGPGRALSFSKTLQRIDLPRSISPVSGIHFGDVSNSPIIFTMFIQAKCSDQFMRHVEKFNTTFLHHKPELVQDEQDSEGFEEMPADLPLSGSISDILSPGYEGTGSNAVRSPICLSSTAAEAMEEEK